MKEKILETMYLLDVCRKAQLVLIGGPILSLLILFFGVHLVSHLNLSGSLQALQEWLQLWIGTGVMLLSAVVAVASCVLVYDACQKYKQCLY